jgi:hypothetical protein
LYSDVIDGLTLVGLLSFPAYSLYWVPYQLRAARRRLWVGLVAFLLWCAATYVCFLWPMLQCLGGHCGERVSPFLELGLAYAGASAALILLMHWQRGKRRD